MSHEPSSWARVRELFLELCDLPLTAREAVLRNVPHTIAEEVRSLLAHQDDDETAVDPWLGHEIRSYRLERVLGRGGSGSVYLARRPDLDHVVAIKLIPAISGERELEARFDDEQRALARLRDDRIARFFDAGSLEGGTGFLVMEYVSGTPIDEFAELHRASVRDRVRLAARVCDAVAVAHQHLVVHGDLKPAHILITPDRSVKLLDFGLARLVAEEGPDRDLEHAAVTPEYASPERLAGSPPDIASDVFALGAVLFQLLTGTVPHPLRTGLRIEALREREISPVAPVSQAMPPRGQRSVRGDLDAVIARALAATPEQRYPSAEAFATDLRRWIDRRPVTARPASWLHRTRLSLRRQWLTSVAAAVILAAVGTTLFGLWSAGERTRAAHAEAEAAVTFLTSLLADANPMDSGHELRVTDAVDRAETRLTQLADSPPLMRRLVLTIAECHLGLGHPERAAALLERHRPADTDEWSDVAAWANTMAHADYELGRFEAIPTLLEPHAVHAVERADAVGARLLNNLGAGHSALGQLDSATEHLEGALRIRVDLGLDQEAAESLTNLAGVARRRQDLAASASLLRRALDLRSRALPEHHPAVLETLGNLTAVQHMAGFLERAEAGYRSLLVATAESLGPDHVDLSVIQSNFAALLASQGRADEAEPLLRRSLELRQSAYSEDDTRVLNAELCLVEAWVATGRTPSAKAALPELQDRLRTRLGEDHPWTSRARAAWHAVGG